jgi:hypothetical protein
MKTAEEKRARVEHLLDFYSPKDANDLAAHEVCQIALEYMDEAKRSNERITELEKRLADIRRISKGEVVTVEVSQLFKSAKSVEFSDSLQGTVGVATKEVAFKMVEDATRAEIDPKACQLALRLLNPDEPCRDPACGVLAKHHRNYNGTSK